MDKYDNTGISIVDLFKVMYGRKLIVLIVTLSVTIIAMIAVALGYNLQNSTYVSTFSYNSADIQQGKYIDGSSFDYRGLISLDVLKNIKSSDSLFNNIDIDKMYENGEITIAITYDKNDLNDTYNVYYKVAIKKKYFKNEFVAKNFISALTEYPVSKTLNIAKELNYNSNLNLYNSATTYESMISYLKAQLAYLDTNYEDMIEKFGDSIINDKKISNYKSELDSYFSEHSLTALENELENNCYVTADSLELLYNNKQAVELTISKINNKIKIFEDQIKRELELVKDSGANINQLDISVFNEELAKLNLELAEAKDKLDYILGLIANSESTDANYIASKKAFDSKLQTSYEKLTEYTDIYKTNYCSVINNNIYVYYTNTKIIVEEQGFSILITGVLGLIAGIIISGIVNLCIDHKKLFKKEDEQQA